MFSDHFSPSAPARVRVLVLPVGRIKRSRFHIFHDLLASFCEIRLGDVSPDPRPDRSAFSPLAFPDGFVLYDFSTDVPSDVHIALSPFELFREPLVVLGILDSKEYQSSLNQHGQESSTRLAPVVDAAIAEMEEKYHRALVHRIIAFDFEASTSGPRLPPNVLTTPLDSQQKPYIMRTVMCDITSAFLAEMTTLAASIKALPSIPSPSTRGAAPYAQFHGTLSQTMSRSNSQSGEGLRSPSPDTNHHHRMSMPVFPTSGVATHGASGESRPSSPETRSQTPPAKTFEELVSNHGSMTSDGKTRPVDSRSNSRDRVSISGFGPSSLDEKNRNKGKCRVSIVISSLQLLAGRWNDALRNLADAAAQARSFGDHIWHAKALENMMTCLILLAWSGSPFVIPPICYPILDRTSSKLAQLAAVTSASSGTTGPTDHTAARRELANVLQDLVNVVVTLYSRAAGISGGGIDYLPQIAYSEVVIRNAKVLTAIQLGKNTFSDEALAYAVRGDQANGIHTPTLGTGRSRVIDMLMRAMPGPPEVSGLSSLDDAMILAGIASVFSSLGLQRKKALVLKEYVFVLIRALDEQKKTGAAEAGIHPSANGYTRTPASFSNVQGTSHGLDDFLNLLCQVYGIPESQWSRSVAETLLSDKFLREDATGLPHLSNDLIGNFILHSFGSISMKSDILRICITLCEALPDPNSVLHWISTLLRTAGPGTAASAQSNDVLVSLSREEQIMLSSTISKTITNSKMLGLGVVEADYWDEFLVRGVFLIESQNALALHPRKRSDLFSDEPKQAVKMGPFIHNPFLETPVAQNIANILVAGDLVEFMVLLQNLYDFDVLVESITLYSGIHKFGSAQNVLLRPFRTQSCSLSGVLPSSGQHELDRCSVKIQGCKERDFLIFASAWKPTSDPKIKSIGQLKSTRSSNRISSDSSKLSTTIEQAYPSPATVPVTIIPPQAVLEVANLSTSQSSLMLLEGERTSVHVTIENKSDLIVADLIHISFNDSTKATIQEALANKKLTSSELYELEHQLTRLPAIRLVSKKPSRIESGQSLDLEFEVLGKPGLTDAMILVDYACLENPHIENKNEIFTRQISISLSITVNSSIQLQRVEVQPLNESFLRLSSLRSNDLDVECCLLVLDLRNVWPSPLEISLGVTGPPIGCPSTMSFFKTKEVVQPGHVSRMIVLIPKIYIKDPHARIRSANERQFVVSTNSMSPENEKLSREIFWYRDALLKILKVTWRQESGAKIGTVDLRNSLRLTPRMADALKLNDVEITISADSAIDGHNNTQVKVDEYMSLKTRIHNRSDAIIRPLLRVRPSLPHQPAEHALDLGKRLAWSGLLQTVLPPISPGDVVESYLGLCVLCAGEYEIGATVEEITVSSMAETDGDYAVPDLAGLKSNRRVWFAGNPCMIAAID